MKFKFQRELEDGHHKGLIIIYVEVDKKYDLRMVLDTGATNTTIDSNALYLFGYDLADNAGSVRIETANGIVESKIFSIQSFESLGIRKEYFEIQAYDFLVHGVFSNYDGIVGLDFIKEMKICIDLKSEYIELTK